MSRYSGGINQGGGGGGGGGPTYTGIPVDTLDTAIAASLDTLHTARLTGGAGDHPGITLPKLDAAAAAAGSRVQVSMVWVGIPSPGQKWPYSTTGGDAISTTGKTTLDVIAAGAVVFYAKSASEWQLEAGLGT